MLAVEGLEADLRWYGLAVCIWSHQAKTLGSLAVVQRLAEPRYNLYTELFSLDDTAAVSQ